VIKEFSAIALLLLSGCAASAPDAETVSRSSVSFVEPEFTDAGRAEFAPTSAGVLRELQKFLVESVAHYLPEPKKRFTDVDLAGDFELFRGPQTTKYASPKVSTRRPSCFNSRSPMALRWRSDRANAT
jgi:hypothetical protein